MVKLLLFVNIILRLYFVIHIQCWVSFVTNYKIKR